MKFALLAGILSAFGSTYVQAGLPPVFGPAASRDQVPGFVCRIDGRHSFGSGILISKREVLTAFHVVDEDSLDDLTIRCDGGKARFKAKKIERSTGYQDQNRAWKNKELDIARLTLKSDTRITPAPLTQPEDFYELEKPVSDAFSSPQFKLKSGVECAFGGHGPQKLESPAGHPNDPTTWVYATDQKPAWTPVSMPLAYDGPRFAFWSQIKLPSTSETTKYLEELEILAKFGAASDALYQEVQTTLIKSGDKTPHLGTGDSGGGYFCRVDAQSPWKTIGTISGTLLLASKTDFTLGVGYLFIRGAKSRFETFLEERGW